MYTEIKRAWINQPSTLQPLHKLNGVNVLAIPEDDKCSRIYFLSGDVISARVPSLVLSKGWRSDEKPLLKKIKEYLTNTDGYNDGRREENDLVVELEILLSKDK